MRWLLVVPLIALPASALPTEPSAAVAEMSSVTAQALPEPHGAGLRSAPTPSQEAPAGPEAHEPHPTPESAQAVEPEATRPAPRVVYAATPETAVLVRSELPPSQRKHGRAYYERAAARCEKRATEWARRKCLERVAAE